MVNRIAEHSHKLHVFLTKRTLAERPQIFLELFQIRRRCQADIHVGIRQGKAVAHTGGGNTPLFGPAARSFQQASPAGSGVTHHAWIVVTQIGKDIVFSATVSGIVTHHDNIEGALSRQLAGELPIVGRDTNTADLALLTETVKLFSNTLGEMLFFDHAEKEKYIDIVGAQLTEPLFQRAAKIRGTPQKVICPGGDTVVFSVAFQGVPQHTDHLCVESVAEEIIETLIQSFIDSSLAWTVGSGQAKPGDRNAGISQCTMGEILIQL